MERVRLQKFLAEAGVASRRAAEQLILAGRVTVNGQIARELGTKVHPAKDQVYFDGTPVQPRRHLYVALHKPAGYHCTRRDPQGRRTIGNLLPKEWAHLYSVGRLDAASQGLLLLTNDGEFSHRVSHPRFGAKKTYHVVVSGKSDATLAKSLVLGIRDGGELLRAHSARLLSSSLRRSVFEVVLAEGKNREIRRMFAALGRTIEVLHRLKIGPIRLGELPEGKWRTLTESEIKSLLATL